MRYAFHLIIKDESKVEEYDKRHAKVWPEMISMLKEAGVSNYSIYRDGVHVFGYWECDDVKKTLDFINSSNINTKWQTYMNDIILEAPEKRTDKGMKEVFHMD